MSSATELTQDEFFAECERIVEDQSYPNEVARLLDAGYRTYGSLVGMTAAFGELSEEKPDVAKAYLQIRNRSEEYEREFEIAWLMLAGAADDPHRDGKLPVPSEVILPLRMLDEVFSRLSQLKGPADLLDSFSEMPTLGDVYIALETRPVRIWLEKYGLPLADPWDVTSPRGADGARDR